MSAPQVFECDDGLDRVVKIEGLATGASLASDWVGSMLAVHLDVLTPAPSLVEASAVALGQLPPELAARSRPGTCYSNAYIRSAMTVHGVQAIVDCPNHDELLSRLLVLDLWIETSDRMRPDFGRNLLIDNEDGDRKLMAIDFGLAFAPVLFPLLGGAEDFGGQTVTVPRPVRPLVDWGIVEETLGVVEAMPDAEIVKLVATVPNAWLDDRRRGTMIRYLLDRRGLLRPALVNWWESTGG